MTADPVGPENDMEIEAWCIGGRKLIAAWGSLPKWAQPRIAAVMELLRGENLECLGINKDGSPKHPLYVRADAAVVPFSPMEVAHG
jgi:hypothetical protein